MKNFAAEHPNFFNSLALLITTCALASCKLPPGNLSSPTVLKADAPPETAVVGASHATDFGTLGLTAESDSARFLAGMPGGGGSNLSAARKTTEWRQHSAQMDAAFAAAHGRLSGIDSWRSSAIGGGGGTLFYPFSGPDFLYADAFFPRHRTIILCGLEPVGQTPDISGVSAETLPAALASVRHSIATPLNFSYFITKDMRVDLADGTFAGVTPVLFTFLARTGHRVIAADPVSIDGSGNIVPRHGGATGTAPGIRIKAASPSVGVRTVYYFRTDLSNGTLGSDKRFLAFVQSQKPTATFVKSASYLMQNSSFSIVRNSIKANSPILVQDPTGVPYKQLAGGGWDIDLHGNYAGTLDMFKNNYQPALAAAYTKAGPKPMGFGVGYKWSPEESSLLVAKKRAGAVAER